MGEAQKANGPPFRAARAIFQLLAEKNYFFSGAGAAGASAAGAAGAAAAGSVAGAAAGSVAGAAAGSAAGAAGASAGAASGAVSAFGPQAATPNARTAATVAARTIFVFVIGQYPSSRRDSFVAARHAYKVSQRDASASRTAS